MFLVVARPNPVHARNPGGNLTRKSQMIPFILVERGLPALTYTCRSSTERILTALIGRLPSMERTQSASSFDTCLMGKKALLNLVSSFKLVTCQMICKDAGRVVAEVTLTEGLLSLEIIRLTRRQRKIIKIIKKFPL